MGNVYEATYPKRAKGLVKNGRARYITDNKIVLARPPEIKTEDNTMSENTYNALDPNEILKRISEDLDNLDPLDPRDYAARTTRISYLKGLLNESRDREEEKQEREQAEKRNKEQFIGILGIIDNMDDEVIKADLLRDLMNPLQTKPKSDFTEKVAQMTKDAVRVAKEKSDGAVRYVVEAGLTARDAAKAARDSVRASREAGEPHYDDEPEEEDDDTDE
jgi:hypothetical protein